MMSVVLPVIRYGRTKGVGAKLSDKLLNRTLSDVNTFSCVKDQVTDYTKPCLLTILTMAAI